MLSLLHSITSLGSRQGETTDGTLRGFLQQCWCPAIVTEAELYLGPIPKRFNLLGAPETTENLLQGCSAEHSESSVVSPPPPVRLHRG